MTSAQTKAGFVRTVAVIVLGGLLFSYIVHFYLYPAIGLDKYPYSTFLGLESLIYSDGIETCHRSRHEDPYSIWTIYFPGALMFLNPFCQLAWRTGELESLFIMMVLANLACVLAVSARTFDQARSDLIFWMLFYAASYPFLYAVNRANVELLVFTLVVAYYGLDRSGRQTGAILVIALAAAFKGVPGIFAVDLLLRRRKLGFFVAMCLIALMTCLGFWRLPGDWTRHAAGLLTQLGRFDVIYAQGLDGLVRSASFYGLVKAMALLVGVGNSGANTVASVLWLGMVVLLFALLGLSYRGRLPASTATNFMLLAMIFMFATRVSIDYKLLVFTLFPLLLDEKEWLFFASRCNTILYALIFVPKNFVIFSQESLTRVDANLKMTLSDVTIGAIMTPLMILALALSFLRFKQTQTRLTRYRAAEMCSDDAAHRFRSPTEV